MPAQPRDSVLQYSISFLTSLAWLPWGSGAVLVLPWSGLPRGSGVAVDGATRAGGGARAECHQAKAFCPVAFHKILRD
jgi:hypothetical protein